MLMLFGLIWLPGLLENTCSLLFLLYYPEYTFLASLSLGSSARQPTDNSALVMSPCLRGHLGKNDRNGGGGGENSLEHGGCRWSG